MRTAPVDVRVEEEARRGTRCIVRRNCRGDTKVERRSGTDGREDVHDGLMNR